MSGHRAGIQISRYTVSSQKLADPYEAAQRACVCWARAKPKSQARARTRQHFHPLRASGNWYPRYRIFGSEELSALSLGVAELCEDGYIEIRADDALGLEVGEGDGLNLNDGLATLEVKINNSIAAGCIGYAAGHSGTANLTPGENISLQKAQGWKRRRPQLIGSDRSTEIGSGND